jgi:tRNA G26 N,N-dimethylase Trm1
VLGIVSRRIFITTYDEADLYEDIPSELKRFLGSSKYRKMVSKVGKQVRGRVLGKANVFDAFTGLADEHSVGLRSIRDQLEYSDDPVTFNDDTVDAFIGDAVNVIVNYLNLDPDAKSASDPDSTTLTSEMMVGFRNLGHSMTVTEMFPDIGNDLTPIDSDQPWLLG